MLKRSMMAAVVAAAGLAGVCGAQATERFSYQGRLVEAGVAADGSYEVQLQFFDAAFGGSSVLLVPFQTVSVEDGLFQVDFGGLPGVFDVESALFVEISVRNAGDAGFTVLSPRQPLSTAPRADLARVARIADQALFAPARPLQDAYDIGPNIVTSNATGPVLFSGNGGTTFSHPIGDVNFLTNTLLRGSDLNGIPRWAISTSVPKFESFLTTGPGNSAEIGSNNFNDGGFAAVRAAAGSNDGIFLEGDRSGTNNPRFSVFGPTSDFIIESNIAGDGAVQLPASSVSPLETSAEAGIDAFQSNAVRTLRDADDGNIITLQTEGFVPPADGYCVVMWTGQLEFRPGGDGLFANIGISNSGTFGSTQDLELGSSSFSPGSANPYAVTVHSIFPVQGGQSETFRVIVQPNMSNVFDTIVASNYNITVMYFPTLYGEFTPASIQGRGINEVPVNGPVSDDTPELSAQQALQRMQSELEQVRAEVEALKQQSRRP